MRNFILNVYFLLITLITGLKMSNLPDLNFSTEDISYENSQKMVQDDLSLSSELSNANQSSNDWLKDIEEKLYFSRTEMDNRFPRIKIEWLNLIDPKFTRSYWKTFCRMAWSKRRNVHGDELLKCDRITKSIAGDYLVKFQQYEAPKTNLDVLICNCEIETSIGQKKEDTFYLTFLSNEDIYLELVLENPSTKYQLKIFMENKVFQ